MKVLHVAEVLKGGVSTYFDEVLNFQKQALGAGNIAIFIPGAEVKFLADVSGVRVFEFDDRGSRVRKTWRLFKSIRESCIKAEADVLHVHGTFAGVACRMAYLTAAKKPKIVYCAHGWSFDRAGSKVMNALFGFVEMLLSHACDKVVCISDHDFESGKRAGIRESKMITIYNGVGNPPVVRRLHTALWPEGGKLRVLFAGRFDRQKGVDVFMAAMASLADHCTGIAIGDSSVGDCDLPSVPQNVRLTGWLPRDEVQEYMKSCDVLVMPSRWEGFGYSAVEAMRASVAVVATKVGALPELIKHNVNGKLIEVNDIAGLIDTLRQLTPAEAARLGTVGSQRYKELFTADSMNQKILKLYDELLAST